MLYIKRLLYCLRPKLQHPSIDLYLMFLESVIYLSPKLQDLFYSEAAAKDQISRIIESNPSSVEVWVGYIHT